MKSEKSSHSHKHKPEFCGCFELAPQQPAFIEFIDSERLWAFPIYQLTHLVLEQNPEHRGQKTLPPDRLTLFYGTAAVVLKGWRLETMIVPLVNGRVVRIHAEKHLGALILDQAWVSEIQIVAGDHAAPPAGPTEARASLQKS